MHTGLRKVIAILLFLCPYAVIAQQIDIDSLLKTSNFDSIAISIFQELDHSEELLGKKLPPFMLNKINGGQLLSSELLFRPTLLFIYNLTCQPCIDLIPVMNETKDELEASIRFIAITGEEDHDALVHFQSFHGFHYDHLYKEQDYLRYLELGVLPKIFLINEDLVVQHIWSFTPENKGKLSFEELEKMISEYLD